MSVVNVSSKSKIVRPKIFISDKLPNDSEQAELKTSRGNITVRTARRRLILNRSCIIATDTSAIETVDVRAATRRRRKKSEDHKRGQGSWANTSGRVTNTSVAPSRGSRSRPKLFTAHAETKAEEGLAKRIDHNSRSNL